MSSDSAPPRPDVVSTLGRFALGALGLVIGAALLFGIVGAVTDDVGDGPEAQLTQSSPPPAATAGPEATPDPTVTGTDEAPATGAPTEAPESPAPTGTEAPEQPTGLDPAEVSVQVLDGVGGGGTAAGVADRLEEAGYNVIAENRAARNYDVTTVFYTEGNEAAAQQIAAEFGFSEVAPQPGNLNEAVAVHIVVGQDAA